MTRQLPMRYNLSRIDNKDFHGKLSADAYDYAQEVANARGISKALAISEILLEHKKVVPHLRNPLTS